MKTDLVEVDWDLREPLTAREVFPSHQKGSNKLINLPTSNLALITDGGVDPEDGPAPRTDGGTTPQQVLIDNGVGSKSGYQGGGYGGTEQAFDVLERFTAEYVDDQRIISSRSIANAVDDDIPVQEIGKTLAAYLESRTPDTFLDDIEVSKWSDSSPIKWTFKRVSGECDTRRSRRLRKVDLVREITTATDAEGAEVDIVHRDGVSWEQTSMTLAWMQDVLEAVCEAADYAPAAVAEQEGDTELTRREWIDQLTKAGATRVLERALGIDAPGIDTSWNKSTTRAIHEVLVEERDPSEVQT